MPTQEGWRHKGRIRPRRMRFLTLFGMTLQAHRDLAIWSARFLDKRLRERCNGSARGQFAPGNAGEELGELAGVAVIDVPPLEGEAQTREQLGARAELPLRSAETGLIEHCAVAIDGGEKIRDAVTGGGGQRQDGNGTGLRRMGQRE
jgi:hypothetical protein